MNEIRILIPPKEEKPTVYAEGILIGKDFFNGETEIILDLNYCFTVYYTYKLHRRLYICCAEDKMKNSVYELPRVNDRVSVVSQLYGRDFDRYKEAMSYLNKRTKGAFYKLPVQFFWQLSILCRKGKNNDFNIDNLVRKYSPKMVFVEIPKEKKEEEMNVR